MKIKNFFDQFSQSPTSTKIAVIAMVITWAIVLGVLLASLTILSTEKPGQALEPTPGGLIPAIFLEPTSGPVGTFVTVHGQGWQAGSTVLIYLMTPAETAVPAYAVAGSAVGPAGQFTAGFVFPSEPRWEGQELALIVARADDRGISAQASFQLMSQEGQYTATPTLPIEPSATPITLIEPTATPVPPATATPLPASPMVTAITDLNVRTGPGTGYPVLGLLRAGQNAEVTGLSADSGWWQIRFPGVTGGYGWVLARYVSVQNVSNVPVIQVPSLPATPTPIPIPIPTPTPVIVDWRGEYYSNPDLMGAPVLVRNDPAIDFNWGVSSPAALIFGDHFSVRWTRTAEFDAATYRFHVIVDDGARLWIDDQLIIEAWYEGSAREVTADRTLSWGTHRLRLEYYEHIGDAQIRLWWEKIFADDEDSYPDWKGRYWSNRHLDGHPKLIRNDEEIDFNWGDDAPTSELPQDNFSARWTRTVRFDAATYRFYLKVDDGARLWMDDELIIDEWHDGDVREVTADYTLTKGKHDLEVEYYEHRGDARIRLEWDKISTPSYPDWKGEYWPNPYLSGSPPLVRNDLAIDFNWGTGSPAPGLPRDNFSARWSRWVTFPTGVYRFYAQADDGISFYIDNRLVLNEWPSSQGGEVYTVEQTLAGPHWLVVDYYEATGAALVRFWWEIQPPPVAAFSASPTSGYRPLTVNFTNQSTGSFNASLWDFGDGTTSTLANPNHTYAAAGVYAVSLTVSGPGGSDTEIKPGYIIVTEPPPVAAFSASPITGQPPLVVQFTDQSWGIINTWLWDFGDGTTSTLPNPTHTYTDVGVYYVTLAISGPGGSDIETKTAYITVVEPTPEPTAEPTEEPVIEPTAGPTSEPTTEPTAEPVPGPMIEPTLEPTREPTAEPISAPVPESTSRPTAKPTSELGEEAG